MKNVALLCYCLPEGMFNDDYSIIFSQQELVERNECNAKSHVATNTNSETTKSHVTSDFSFRCKDAIPANLNLYAKDIENERMTMENAFSMVTMSVILSDFGIACGPTSKLVWLRLLTLFHHLHPDDDKSQISIAEFSFSLLLILNDRFSSANIVRVNPLFFSAEIV
jgi:hypothetical protein